MTEAEKVCEREKSWINFQETQKQKYPDGQPTTLHTNNHIKPILFLHEILPPNIYNQTPTIIAFIVKMIWLSLLLT